jgi:ABC-type multidrug transport system ATPase subunit
MSGNIFVNNQPMNPLEFKQNVAYVTQHDSLLSTFTPREALQFSASLRLRKSHEEIEIIISQTISALGLTTCADSLIGDDLIKGLSGITRFLWNVIKF